MNHVFPLQSPGMCRPYKKRRNVPGNLRKPRYHPKVMKFCRLIQMVNQSIVFRILCAHIFMCVCVIGLVATAVDMWHIEYQIPNIAIHRRPIFLQCTVFKINITSRSTNFTGFISVPSSFALILYMYL